MKAVVLKDYIKTPSDLKTVEVPIPTLSEKKNVLIKVDSVGLNFADAL